MKRTAAICVALVFSLVCSVYADFGVTDTGTWPKSWPAELEPLRKQSRTFEGPKQPLQHHAIPFTKRDEFESAWPHLLKIKSKGAPIVLRRAPSFWLGDKATAGVCVHTPPAGEAPIADGKDAKGNWEKTIYLELIVDGEIIDLNRIPLPADTPIIDERFPNNAEQKQSQQSTAAEDRVVNEAASKKTDTVLKQPKSDVLFEDDFTNGLADIWQVVGLQKQDYRIRDGGLEMRVQPGKRTRDTPMLRVILPFATTSTVIASVDVTILNEFTEDGEFGGLCLIANDDVEFTVKKLRVNGSLVFAPGKYEFAGKPGDEGEPRNYTIKYWPALDEFGPLRIIVRQKYAHFQVGPSSEDKFLNFFHSAIADSDKKCGFSLVAAGAPKDAVHWVRFDNFRVTR